MLTNGGPRESFYRKVFNEILTGLGTVTIPDLPAPDTTMNLDLSKYEGVYGRPGARYEVTVDGGKLYLTLVLDPMQAEFLQRPDRIRYELLPVTETHFLMPPSDPLEDIQTVAIYDFTNGTARFLHTNCRVNPRLK
jgi:hypothetical protein